MVDLSGIKSMSANGGGLKELFIPKQSRLPSEYQEVEWIASDGTGQYITLDYYPYSTLDLEIDCEYTEKSGTGSATNIFIADNWNGSSRSNSIAFGNGTSTSTNTQYLLIGNSAQSFTYTFGGVRRVVHLSDKKLYIDNDLKYTHTNTYTGTSTVKLSLFGSSNSHSILKIYSCTIKDSPRSDVALELVPCYHKTTGVIGLYDIANDVFYDNDGTGTFTKGADVSKNVIWKKESYHTIFYDDASTDRTSEYTKTNWGSSNPTFTFENGFYRLKGNTSAGGSVSYLNIPITQSYDHIRVNVDLKINNSYGAPNYSSSALIISSTQRFYGTSDKRIEFGLFSSASGVKIVTTTTTDKTSSYVSQLQTWYHLEIELNKTEGNVKASILKGTEEVYSLNFDVDLSSQTYNYLGIFEQLLTEVDFKNLKLEAFY